MTEQVLSVCWKEHTSELATVYKSLLENNFLVDCTISAEGRSLKAHRLVLSACSPYFHMLFCEETGVHPFVILLNVSFETLKAVIDFVYQGETQIPEGNLEGFLSLAQALKIKGLNEFTQDYTNRNLSRNTNGNTPRESTESNQDTCEVQCISVNEESHLNTGHTHSSVPSEPHNSSSEEEQSASVMPPLQELQTSIKQEPLFPEFTATNERLDGVKSNETVPPNCTSGMNEEAFVFSEQDLNQYSSCGVSSRGNVKSSMITRSQQQHMQLSNEVSSGRDVEQLQPLSPVMLVPKREQMDYTETEEPLDEYDVPGNEKNEIDERMEHPSSEQNVNHWSRADCFPAEIHVATQEPSEVRQPSESSPPHTELQLQEGPHAHPGEQTVLSDEDGMDVAHLPSTSTGKPRRAGKQLHSCELCEKTFTHSCYLDRHKRIHTGERPYQCDVCSKRFVRSHHLQGHMRCHTGERPYHCDMCGADGLALEEDLATQGLSPPGQQSESSPPHTELQLHEAPHAHPGEQAVPSVDGEMALAHVPSTSPRKAKAGRPRKGGIALAHLPSTSTQKPRRTEKPLNCEVCRKSFSRRSQLNMHKRTHREERPYRCDVCGKAYRQKSYLVHHLRSHNGERPYCCRVCGKLFSRRDSLSQHTHIHTGERPYACNVCPLTFRFRGLLSVHKRTHAEKRKQRARLSVE